MTDQQAPSRRRRRAPEDVPAQEPEAAPAAPQSAATGTRPRRPRQSPTAPVTPAATSPADGELFQSAPDQRTDISKLPRPDMQHGFQVIVDDLFASGFNVAQEWASVREGLEIKDALTPQRLRRAANEQEATADRAHQLYIIAKVEVQAYLRETEPTHGAIREAAVQSLEQQKASGARTKQITDADALAEAARLFPDEWMDICQKRERAAAMLKHLENLAALARSRCYTVSSMANPSSRLGE